MQAAHPSEAHGRRPGCLPWLMAQALGDHALHVRSRAWPAREHEDEDETRAFDTRPPDAQADAVPELLHQAERPQEQGHFERHYSTRERGMTT